VSSRRFNPLGSKVDSEAQKLTSQVLQHLHVPSLPSEASEDSLPTQQTGVSRPTHRARKPSRRKRDAVLLLLDPGLADVSSLGFSERGKGGITVDKEKTKEKDESGRGREEGGRRLRRDVRSPGEGPICLELSPVVLPSTCEGRRTSAFRSELRSRMEDWREEHRRRRSQPLVDASPFPFLRLEFSPGTYLQLSI